MSVTNKRWENQTITPKHDSIQFDNGQNGILYGCEITHLGSNILRMAAGYIVLCGRLIEVDQTDINCEVASSGTTNGQMIIRLNLGAVDSVEIITEAASSLTPLTQNEDANYEDGIYEIQLAQYTISETVLSDLTVTAPVLEKLGTEVNTIKENLTAFNVDTKQYTDTVFKLAINNDEELGMLDGEGNFMSFGGNSGVIVEPVVVNKNVKTLNVSYIPKITGTIVLSINCKNNSVMAMAAIQLGIPKRIVYLKNTNLANTTNVSGLQNSLIT